MAESGFIGVVRHDGSKVWVIPGPKVPEKLRKNIKPCVWRPKKYACDILKELAKQEKLGPPHHKHHYDCLDCLKTQHDLKAVQNIIDKHLGEIMQKK